MPIQLRNRAPKRWDISLNGSAPTQDENYTGTGRGVRAGDIVRDTDTGLLWLCLDGTVGSPVYTFKGDFKKNMRRILVDPAKQEVPGYRYKTYDAAATYIKSVSTPSYSVRWVVEIVGTYTGNITLQPYIYIEASGCYGGEINGNIYDDNVSADYEAYQCFRILVKSCDPNRMIIFNDSIISDQITTNNSGRLVLYSTKLYSYSAATDVSSIQIDVLEGSQIDIYTLGNCVCWGDSYVTIRTACKGNLQAYGAGNLVYLYGNVNVDYCYLYNCEIYGYGFTMTLINGVSQIINAHFYNAHVKVSGSGNTLDVWDVRLNAGSTIAAESGGSLANHGSFYDDRDTALGADNYQAAIEKLTARIKNLESRVALLEGVSSSSGSSEQFSSSSSG